MSAAYETFVHDLDDLRVGQETPLVLRDLAPGRRKYFARHVVAVVTDSPDAGRAPLLLRVRSAVGNVFPGEWHVRVVRELPARIPGVPYGNAFDALRAAGEATVAKA